MSSERLNLSQTEQPEYQEELPTAECLIILGAGIDQVTVRDKEGREEKIWKPSRYVVETDSTIAARDKRSGVRKSFTKDERLDKTNVIHGGTAHLLAGIEFLDEMRERGTMPRRVVFAAGRADYIQNATDDLNADEGIVMSIEFAQRTAKNPFTETEIEVRGKGTQNTAGDLLNGLKAAFDSNLNSTVIIVTEARMERTKAICVALQERFPKLTRIRTTFVSAEDILRRRYANNPARAREFEKIQKELKGSLLWEETERREKKGIEDLKKGAYDLRISDINTSGLE